MKIPHSTFHIPHRQLGLGHERGAVAIFFASIMGILLMVSTTSAARLMVSELGQSSQVDRSEQAYYAAEAGVEDAIYRIQQANQQTPSTPPAACTIFPQQYDIVAPATSPCDPLAVQDGDYAIMTAQDGSWPNTYTPTLDTTLNPTADNARLAWRGRKVYDSRAFFVGTQVKDQSVQVDTSDLRRKNKSGPDCGLGGLDCDKKSIFGNFAGLEYCWQPAAGVAVAPQIELTVVSWSADPSNIDPTTGVVSNILTDKAMVTAGPGGTIPPHAISDPSGVAIGSINQASLVPGSQALPGFTNCFEFQVYPSRRYIFRLKPIFNAPGAINNFNQAGDTVSYQIALLDVPVNSDSNYGPLYIPNGDYYIDVVGQASDVRRRIVAKALVNGQLLGIFDYILYTGDPVIPLCKAGVQYQGPSSTYTNTCIVQSISNP